MLPKVEVKVLMEQFAPPRLLANLRQMQSVWLEAERLTLTEEMKSPLHGPKDAEVWENICVACKRKNGV